VTAAIEFIGGSLDGAVLSLPATACAVQTTGGSSYVIDDAARAWFTGHGHTGRQMTSMFSSARDHRDIEAAERALQPRGCRDCGATFADLNSWTVHRDPRWPGGCLPPGALGQLQERDGIWVVPGSDAARS